MTKVNGLALPGGAAAEVTSRSAEGTTLAEVWHGHSRHVHTLCLRLLADSSAAEAVTVDVFVRLGREFPQASQREALVGRLVDMAIARSLARLRQSGRFQAAGVELGASAEETDTVYSLSDPAAVEKLLFRLPTLLRVVYVLCDAEGMGTGRVAAHLGVAEAEVRRVLHEARLMLRRLALRGGGKAGV